jgi:hypothetical protein
MWNEESLWPYESETKTKQLETPFYRKTERQDLPLKREWLTADLHPSLIPQGFSPLGRCHPRHSRFESKKPCETKPWRNSTTFHSRFKVYRSEPIPMNPVFL